MSTFADALSSDGKYPKICVDNKQVVTTDHLLEQSRGGGEQISISDVTPASGQRPDFLSASESFQTYYGVSVCTQ